MKVAGLWSGHDCSFCVLEDGKPIIHAELERYIREKEPKGDSPKFLRDVYGVPGDIQELATCYPGSLVARTQEDFLGNRNLHVVGHHQAHAAHAFFSSNFDDAVILTIDGGGVESDTVQTATTIWKGNGRKIEKLKVFPLEQVNIGGLWTRVTRYIFRMQNGWPLGHQAGSIMAMAALGDGRRFYDDFYRMLTTDLIPASQKPAGQPLGAYTGNDPDHPYLKHWQNIADRSESDKFDLAASLQAATETIIFKLVEEAKRLYPSENLCVAGGVALNSVAMGKLWSRFDFKGIYIPPVPYDGGLCLGAAQYVWHHVMDNERIKWEDNFTPYLGEEWDRTIPGFLRSLEDELDVVFNVSESDIVDLLESGKIISVYSGQSESGRRALGNRSIVADPRTLHVKDVINAKVKHRQWYRPFAPSILREDVADWFERDIDSPYMQFVVNVKESVRTKIPAVVHFDGTARLQTVTENDNPIFYSLISAWKERTGIPILLNTSFNDREPIVETPRHAVDCFLKTEIDYLWFAEYDALVSRRKTNGE